MEKLSRSQQRTALIGKSIPEDSGTLLLNVGVFLESSTTETLKGGAHRLERNRKLHNDFCVSVAYILYCLWTLFAAAQLDIHHVRKKYIYLPTTKRTLKRRQQRLKTISRLGIYLYRRDSNYCLCVFPKVFELF